MPILGNPVWEAFARNMAGGGTPQQAYLDAKGPENITPAAAAVSANRLLKRPDIDARIRELQHKAEQIEIKATAKALEKHTITMERVLAELAKIGFADVSQALKWGAQVVVPDGDGGEIEVANTVALIDSDKLPPEVTGAIAEVSQTAQGIRIKFHDKKGALLALKEHLEKAAGAEQPVDTGAAPRPADADHLAELGPRFRVVAGGKA